MSAISRSSSSVDDGEPFLPQRNGEKSAGFFPTKKRRLDCGPALPWIVSTGILSVLCVVLALRDSQVRMPSIPKPTDTFETGFDTDLDIARVAIETHHVKFSGGLMFMPNGTMYRDLRPGEPLYFGIPSPEIDKAWWNLLYSSALDLEGDDANTVKNETFEEPLGHMWRTGLDVFHALHCLNQVRQALDGDYYPVHDPPGVVRMHREHCLDYIRQQLQCQADITPVILKWSKRVHMPIPQFSNAVHTCRNFDRIHAWSKERAAERYYETNHQMILKAIAAGKDVEWDHGGIV